MEIVVVDIGGTHARFAIARIEDRRVIALEAPTTLHTAGHASLQTAWHAFACQRGAPLPRAAAIAVASPVGGELIKLTNNPWTIRPAAIADQLGVDNLTLINDFAAVGHAVVQLPDADFLHLCGPDISLPSEGVIGICGPGTGLGVAAVHRVGGTYNVLGSEGGHKDFAPLDAIEDEMLRRLRQKLTRVSVERVVSGPGIAAIYGTLAAIEGRAIAPAGDRAIWDRALSGTDSLATAALDRFCLALGAFAGDVALTQGATAMVIAGGLGLRLKDRLLQSGFGQRFVAKGRFAQLMDTLPVKLITHDQPGLFGAAAAFVREHC